MAVYGAFSSSGPGLGVGAELPRPRPISAGPGVGDPFFVPGVHFCSEASGGACGVRLAPMVMDDRVAFGWGAPDVAR